MKETGFSRCGQGEIAFSAVRVSFISFLHSLFSFQVVNLRVSLLDFLAFVLTVARIRRGRIIVAMLPKLGTSFK